MNAERLHAIVNALAEELSAADTPNVIRQLTSALQQPQDPSQQQVAANLRQQLEERLAQAPSNEFSPAWKQSLEELGVADLFGTPLLEQIESILARNEITPSAAATELATIADRLDALNAAISQIRPGFQFFNIGAEELEPGDFEIGFLIPRPAVDDELQELGEEFGRLKRILGPFLELATGTREDVRVRSLASSDFQVFLHSAPAVALMIATTLERLIASYSNIMSIRVAHQNLKDNLVPDEALAGVLAEAETRMERTIGALADELLAENAPADQARANELRKDLVDALNKLANRIDKGYTVEVRAGKVSDADEGEEDSEERTRREIARAVIEKQRRIQFTNLTGAPILQLPEVSDLGPHGSAEAAAD
jgi:hypothetical protein